MKKKIMLVMLAFLLPAAVFMGCNNKYTGKDGDAYTLTFYRARESGMSDGADDVKVTKALEDKFHQDTGTKIKLSMKMETNNDLPTQVDLNFGNTRSDMEGVVHYLSEDSGSAVTKYAREEDACIDFAPLLEEHGQNILAKIRLNDTGHLAERAGWFRIGDEYKMTALPSVQEEGGFAIMLRKDYMKKVQSTTALDPEDYDVMNDGYKNMTVAEFDKLMRAINKSGGDITYPVSGYPWDISRVISTALGVDGFGYGLDTNGKYVPPQLTQGFGRQLKLMYEWAKDGVWEKDNVTLTEEQRLTNFVAGKSAAFICYPEAKQLIKVAKTFYNANNQGDLMVIAPLALSDESGNVVLENGKPVVYGNYKNPRGRQGLIAPFTAKNTDKMVMFIDWMYSDPANYELAKYGIKGTHWVEGADKTVSGKTYKTWKYPDGKEDSFASKPPYSGMWEILPNINVSNRIYAGYNTVETKWYVAAYHEFPLYSNTVSEGVWMPSAPRNLGQQAQNIDGKYVDNVRGKAWNGILGDYGSHKGLEPAQLLEKYIEDVTVSAAGYLTYLDTSYKEISAYFNAKWPA